MSKSLLLLLLSTIFVGCGAPAPKSTTTAKSDSSTTATIVEQVALPALSNETQGELTDEVFGEVIELKGVSVPTDDIFGISEAQMLVRDSLLFLKTIQGDKLLRVYSLPDFKLVATAAPKGRGPGEFQFPDIIKSNAKDTLLYLYESSSSRIYALKSDYSVSIAHQGEVDGNQEQFSSYNRQWGTLDNAPNLVYMQQDYEKKKNEILVNKVVGDSVTTTAVADLTFNPKYKNWPAYIGSFGVNEKLGRAYYAYKYFKRVVVCDINSGEFKVLDFDTAQSGLKNGSMDQSVTHYWKSANGDDHFYLLYSGRTPVDVGRDNSRGNAHIFIEKYDWNGTPVAKYRLDGWGYFTVDEARGKIYLCSTTEEHPFMVYDLP